MKMLRMAAALAASLLLDMPAAAQVSISGLPAASSASPSDITPCTQSLVTRKCSVAQMVTGGFPLVDIGPLTPTSGAAPTDLIPCAASAGGTGSLRKCTTSAVVSAGGAALTTNNLADLTSPSAARTHLGLGAATSSTLGLVKPDGSSVLNNAGALSATAASVGALSLSGGALSGTLSVAAQAVVATASTGLFLRNDGSSAYLLKSNTSPVTFDSARPFAVNLSTGSVTIDGTGLGTTFGGGVTESTRQIPVGSTPSISIPTPSGYFGQPLITTDYIDQTTSNTTTSEVPRLTILRSTKGFGAPLSDKVASYTGVLCFTGSANCWAHNEGVGLYGDADSVQSGNGSQTVFSRTGNATSFHQVQVLVAGTVQPYPSAYSLAFSGSTITVTFASAPPSGSGNVTLRSIPGDILANGDEMDFNNFNYNYDAAPSPSAFMSNARSVVGVSGAGLYRNTAMFFGASVDINGGTEVPSFNYGDAYVTNAIRVATHYDATKSAESYSDIGTHNIGIDGSSAHYAAASIVEPGGFSVLPNGGVTQPYTRYPALTVAQLATYDPSPVAGDRSFVTDAATCAYRSAVSGGGAQQCSVAYLSGSWVAD